ncbi:hypothetical protein, partial [Streptomyces sp. NPDC060077]|uniref:hypothetical protein n=1 Tax=Streptomyces sp. NPDC060077 TaxID=3347052 RepID=UPI003667B26E
LWGAPAATKPMVSAERPAGAPHRGAPETARRLGLRGPLSRSAGCARSVHVRASPRSPLGRLSPR